MAYAYDHVAALNKQFEKAQRRETQPPRAILLSAGGNDLLAAALPVLLNHREAPGPQSINNTIRDELLARIETAYEAMLGVVTEYSCRYFDTSLIPVIVHGYDYPIPDGRKPSGFFLGLASLFGVRIPGPWLQPAFIQRGYVASDLDATTERAIIKENRRC